MTFVFFVLMKKKQKLYNRLSIIKSMSKKDLKTDKFNLSYLSYATYNIRIELNFVSKLILYC